MDKSVCVFFIIKNEKENKGFDINCFLFVIK